MGEFGSAFLMSPEQNMSGGSGRPVVCRVSGGCAPACGVVRDV